MGKLRFYSKDGCLVTVPGAALMIGQPRKYVGRELRELNSGGVKRMAYAATSEPYQVDEDSSRARRLIKLTRRDSSLWPADEHTALACGVPFVPVRQDADGEWIADEKETD